MPRPDPLRIARRVAVRFAAKPRPPSPGLINFALSLLEERIVENPPTEAEIRAMDAQGVKALIDDLKRADRLATKGQISYALDLIAKRNWMPDLPTEVEVRAMDYTEVSALIDDLKKPVNYTKWAGHEEKLTVNVQRDRVEFTIEPANERSRDFLEMSQDMPMSNLGDKRGWYLSASVSLTNVLRYLQNRSGNKLGGGRPLPEQHGPDGITQIVMFPDDWAPMEGWQDFLKKHLRHFRRLSPRVI